MIPSPYSTPGFPLPMPYTSGSAPVSTRCFPGQNPAPLPFPALPRPLPTGKLLELREDRLEEVIVDLVNGTVVPNVEEVVHCHGVRGALPQCQAVPGAQRAGSASAWAQPGLQPTPVL